MDHNNVRNSQTIEMDAVSKALASIYTGVFLIDVMRDTYSIVKAPEAVQTLLDGVVSAQDALNIAVEKTVFQDEIARMRSFVKLDTISDRIGHEKSLNIEYQGVISGWVRGSFMEVERDSGGKLIQILYVYQVIDEDKRKELDHIQYLKDSYELSEQENKTSREKNAALEEDKLFLEDENSELQRSRDAVLTILKSGAYLCTYAEDGETLESIKFSDALRKLYGYSGIDDAPDTWDMWLKGAHPDDRKYVEECYAAALRDRTGNTKYDVTFRAVKKDGTICWYRAAADIIRRTDGTAELCYGLIMDVDAQKRAENQVQEALNQARIANAAKSSFLARMSHDIRTPMNGIMGLIEINERHANDVELMSQNRKKMKVAADHLLSLINDVLQLSKLEDPKVELSYEVFNLQQLSEAIIIIMEQRAIAHQITIERDDDPSIQKYPFVYGSPLHVKQIFINLLGNSIKYNKDKGSIYCHASMEETGDNKVLYKVVIKDTGIGMSEDFLQHLYEPFAREQKETEGGYEGTGLGMSIVKQLLDKMGGSIQVESTLGAGSCFTVEIPFDIADEEALDRVDNDALPKDLTGIHVLLVEDNELNRDIARMILNDAGVEVTMAVNGQEAVTMFETHTIGTFDAILMDVMMPVMNGYEATEMIRSLEREDAKEIPIIAISANAFDEDVERAMKAGMNDHLSKPLNIKKMIATIAKYVELN